jgi:uncharacterized protein DUF3500
VVHIGMIASMALFCASQEGPVPNLSADVFEATTALLNSLEPEQRQTIVFDFDDDYRLDWHFVPRTRRGLNFTNLTESQETALRALLKTLLSERGYEKAEQIRVLEKILRQLERATGPNRDPQRYTVTLFGEPAQNGAWGLRYEGHHISFNWTFVDGKMQSSTPQFLGANPAEVHGGEHEGLRVLALEEDLGRRLVKSLDPEQAGVGIVSVVAPPDILTSADRQAAAQENLGVPFPQLSAEQQGLLLQIVQEYASSQPNEVVDERLAKIREKGLELVKFAWMGGLDRGEGHYYRVQGPTFILEYDNTQNQANHIHTVWRDFRGDFGRDVLQQHYAAHSHPDDSHGHDQ